MIKTKIPNCIQSVLNARCRTRPTPTPRPCFARWGVTGVSTDMILYYVTRLLRVLSYVFWGKNATNCVEEYCSIIG